jgi:hypothetical protein
MNKSTLRIISKIGFFLVLIGFFMPFALNMNSFQITEYLSDQLQNIHSLVSNPNKVEFNPMMNIIGFSSYFIFIFSSIGVLLFVFQILKKNVNIVVDYVNTIAMTVAAINTCIGVFVIYKKLLGYSYSELVEINNLAKNLLKIFNTNIFQIGALIIQIGIIYTIISYLVLKLYKTTN